MQYVVAIGVFFIVDLIWIGWVAADFYARHVGGMLRESVHWGAALSFYALYIGGIVHFVLMPAAAQRAGLWQTARSGGLLGCFAYGTFNLTALALLDGWSATVTVVDMIWGTFLTGGTAAATLWITNQMLPSNLVTRSPARRKSHGHTNGRSVDAH